MLGVATLIVVLSVMNGFRKELLDKIVGINGHMFVAPIDRPLTDYAEVADRIAKLPGVRRAIPLVEGQAFASSQYNGSGVLVRGVRGSDMQRSRGDFREPAPGHARGFRHGRRRRRRQAARREPEPAGRRHHHVDHAARRGDAVRHGAAHQGLPGRRRVRDRHVRVRRHLHVHAARRGAGLFQPRRRRQPDRGVPRRCRPRRRGARGHRRGGRAPDRAHRLAAAQPHLLRGARGGAQRHVPHPDADRPGRGAQHHLRPDHAGEGQERRHRHPAHHGRHARRRHARLPDHRRVHRHRRHPGRLRRSGSSSPSTSRASGR